MNEYLKLVREEAPAPPPADNPYLPLVRDDARAQAQRARTVIEHALRDDPDIAAERLRISKMSGVPLRVVERNLDELRIKERARAIDIARMAQNSPILARQLTDPTFATTSVDDLDTLANIERAVRDGVKYVTGGEAADDVVGGVKTLALGGTVGIGKMAFDIAGAVNDLIGWDTGAQAARGAASRAQKAMDEAGMQADTSTGRAVKSGLQSFGQNLALLPLGLQRQLFATAEAAGSVVAGVMALGVGAGAYNKARDQGRSQLQAGIYAVPEGAFEYVFEKIPASKLFKDIAANRGLLKTIGNQMATEQWTEQLTTLAQDFNEWMNLNPDKTMAEFIRERPEAAYQTMVATAVGVGVQTTTIHSLNKLVEKVSNQQLKFELDAFNEQLKLAGQSALRERSPEQFRALVQQVVDNNDSAKKEIYVDAEVLHQLPADLLEQLPASVREQIDPALAAGATVAIPMADVLTVAPGTPLEQALNDNARMTPDAPSRVEAQQAAEKVAEFSAEADRIIAEAENAQVMADSAEQVKKTVLDQLVATKRFSPDVADAYATLARSFYTVTAARLGLTPDQLYAKYPLRVQAGTNAPQTDVLNDADRPGRMSVEGYHFSTAERPFVSTGAFGTGLQGSNRDQYLNAKDARLRKRAYFYVDKGTGITPEAGVGGIGHRAQLSNVYDSDADPLRLKVGRDQLGFESAVLDAGFSGYLTRMDGTQPGQVIMLGDQVVKTDVLGPLSNTTGAVVPPPTFTPSRGRDQVVDRLRANKALPAGSPTLARWAQILSTQMPEEYQALAAAGVFDGDATASVYRDTLIREFIKRTEAPAYEQRAEGDTRYQARAKELLAGITPPKRSAVGIMRGEVRAPTFKNLFELSRWFTARNARGAEDMNDPAVRKRMLDALYADTLHALTDAGSAVGWYDAKVKAALDLMAQIHPEIATDEQARFGFIAILAITSNQTRVNENFDLADALYSRWKETGALPTNVGEVRDTRAKTEMSKALSKLNQLVGQHGWQAVRDFMTSYQTARDITAFTGFPVTGENLDTKIYGAVFLGPKIGAFFNNLYGNFDTVTMDRWFMRTINRIRGSMLRMPDSLTDNLATLVKQLDQGVDTFGVNADEIRAEVAAFNALPPAERTSVETVLRTLPRTREYVSARHKVFAKGREVGGKERGYVDRTPENQLAKNLDLALHLDQQTPRGGDDRNLMRSLVLKLQQKLKDDGIDMVVADIQAALWYYEKDLVARLRGKADAQGALFDGEQEAEDYETAAKRVVARYTAGPGRADAGPADGSRPGAASGRAVDSRVDTTGDLFAQGGLPATLDDFRPERIANVLNRSGWAILTAENPMGVEAAPEANAAAQSALQAALDAAGFKYLRAIGSYGNKENPFVVIGITEDQALALGARFRQDSVLTNRGLVYPRDGSVTPATGITIFETAPEDFYTEIPELGTRFVVNLDFAGTSQSAAGAEQALQARVEGDFDALAAEYAALPNTDGGRILNTDEARELSPWYRDDRSRSADIHEPASEFVKRLYAAKLAQPTPAGVDPVVLFTAGGTGAGKSSALPLMGVAASNAEMVYDTNMNTFASADKKVQQALDAGRAVVIVLTVRDPVEAMTMGALPRAMRMGRTVPLREHAKTHQGADATVRRLAEKYAGDERVVVRVVDNTRGRGAAAEVSLADAPTFDYNGLEEKLYAAATTEFQAGRISETVYRGTVGAEAVGAAAEAGGPADQSPGGQPEQQDARLNQTDTPAFRKWFGDSKVVDADGKPLVVYHGGLKFNAFRNSPDSVAHYASDDVATAFGYADQYSADRAEVKPLYLKIENPLDLRDRATFLQWTGVDPNDAPVFSDWGRKAFMAHEGFPMRSGGKVLQKAKADGYDGVIFYDTDVMNRGLHTAYAFFTPTQAKAAPADAARMNDFDEVRAEGNSGAFDPTNPDILHQGPRGTFSPSQLLITLNENTDLSTFIHELGHFFLEVQADIASQPGAPEDITADMNTLLAWFGVKDLAEWNAMTLEQKRKHHERLAEGFEQYILEGKAPSLELRSLFRRLRAFMVHVYKSLQAFMRGRNLNLSDDVRQVFDRMVATDEQIAEAERLAGMLPNFDATNEAIEKLQARSIRDLKWAVNARNKAIKEMQKTAAEARKSVEEEARAEIEQDPAVRAKRALDALRKAAKRAPTDQEMATIADSLGYDSVDTMLQAIDAFGPIEAAVEGRTDQLMLERHGDLIDQRAIEEAATEAVHNQARAKVLAAELKAQADAMNPRQDTGRVDSRGRPITANALEMAAREFAADVAARVRLKDLKNTAWQYRAAEARAAKRWQEATAKGDTEAALAAKRDQLLNNAIVRALTDARTEAKKAAEFFKRITKGSDEKIVERGRDPDVVNAMRAILASYGVAPRLGKTAFDYMDKVAAYDPAMHAALRPAVDAAVANAQPLDELSVEQLQGLHADLRAMWDLAKRSRQMEVDGNLMDLDDAAQELLARMEEKGIPDSAPGEAGAITPQEKLGLKLKTARAILTRAEQWAERMDGKFGGPFLRLVFQPVKEAADRYRTARVEYRTRYTDLIKAVAPSLKPGAIDAPELGYRFGNARDSGQAELLHALLHLGNDSNKRKLLLGGRPGKPWARLNADGTLDTTQWDSFLKRMHDTGVITKAHWDFVQGVWDLLEETKPLAQQTHRKVFGRFFNEVTAAPVDTPFGVYRGGYVPAQVDPQLVHDNEQRKLAEAENETMAYSFPAAPSGFTKSRVESYTRPLALDLRLLAQHIDKVLLFSHMQAPVNDVRRLLSNKGVHQSLTRIDPTIYSGMLLPWLNTSVRQMVETPAPGDGGLSRLATAARSRAGMALMMANVSNTVQQITGFTLAAVKVKPSAMLSAAALFVRSPKQMRETVATLSDAMRFRMQNDVAAMVDVVEDILVNPSLYERSQAWTQRHAYFLQTAFDNTMSPIIWTAAYNQGVADGMSEQDAIRFADGTIRQTQGSTLPEDVSRFETGQAAIRLFTQFMNYFNMMANTNATAAAQIVEELGLRRGAGKLLYVALAGLLAPIWVAEAIAQAFRGGPDDEDKDGFYLDDWLMAVFGLGTLRGMAAQVPLVGQAAQLVVNRFNDNPADDKFSLSPAVSLIESGFNAPFSVYNAIVKDGSAMKASKDVAAAATMATGLPFYAAARPVAYGVGVAEGKVRPTSDADMVRGLVTGTPSKESRQP